MRHSPLKGDGEARQAFARNADPAVRYVDNVWIPMPDGIRLAASLWLPVSPEPVPAIVEILPYRKRDHTAARDHVNHSHLARNGFAGVRVDMRGTGDSDGLFDAEQTYRDILNVLEWLREQEWCSGSLGMLGLSWGGINAIMAAAQRPEGLGAVVACSFAHDRYSIGMVWKNACLLNENFAWSTAVSAFCTRPPDPMIMGERWRSAWQERLEKLEPLVLQYFAHQRRDEYWDRHRVADLSRIEAPLLLFAGWADSNYAQSVPALLEGVSGPCRAVIGSWGHKYPHYALPGPPIDFLDQATRWFSRWLKDDANGADEEPTLIAHMQEDLPAQPAYAEAPGRWTAHRCWPPAGFHDLVFYLGDGTLAYEAPSSQRLQFRSPQTTGLASGEVMPCFNAGLEPELPGDQREDDGKSLVFDSPPLDHDFETLGAPVLDLEFSVDQPVAFLAIRICDVKPDGTSARVNLGLHNLTRRQGDRDPLPLEPGVRYRLSLPLDVKGYVFGKGHRVRLALSTTYWPMVWPSPTPVTLSVHTGASTIAFPHRVRPVEQSDEVALGTPMLPTDSPRRQVEPAQRQRTIEHDVMTRETTLRIVSDDGVYRLDGIDWEVQSDCEEVHRMRDEDPLSARTEITWNWRFRRGAWKAETQTVARMTCSAESFFSTLEVRAYEDGAKVFDRRWETEIPRDLL